MNSSGAAAAPDVVACLEEHLPRRPLRCKREQKPRLGGTAETLAFRAYAVSGRFLRDPEQCARGDFLLRALGRFPIVIKAPMPVICGYGHAGHMVNLAFRLLWIEPLPPAHPIAALSQEVGTPGVGQSDFFSLRSTSCLNCHRCQPFPQSLYCRSRNLWNHPESAVDYHPFLGGEDLRYHLRSDDLTGYATQSLA